MLTVGRPRCCTPRGRCCGPYTIATVIMVGAAPLGIGADDRTAAVLYALDWIAGFPKYISATGAMACSPAAHSYTHWS